MTHEAGIEAAAQEFANCWLASFDSHKIRNNEFAERIIKSYLSASGMVLMPREPTEQMMKSELDKAVYKAYLADAPNPFKSKP